MSCRRRRRRRGEIDYETDKQLEASGLSKVNPNSLIERPELLETKVVHDGIYEMLNISKQLLSTKNINEKQLDNFVLNYGK